MLIHKALSTAFLDDTQIGDEHGISAGTSGLGWAIDPLDGTAPNLNGLPGWCASIGLMDDEERPVLRAICARVLDEMFVAARGLGRIRLWRRCLRGLPGFGS